MITLLKRILSAAGLPPGKVARFISHRSLKWALSQDTEGPSIGELRRIVPDISNQESSEKDHFDDYFELKRRGMHSFQCRMMLRLADGITKDRVAVVDIGDSAGTHMLYLRSLLKGRAVETISVNLDSRAIEKIKARGLTAVLSRAEDLKIDGGVDAFVSFEMLEHLHNPAIFLRRLALRDDQSRLLITVPYRRRSRVGLHHVRWGTTRPVHAEEEHVFELSPDDWTLLMRHSGWRVRESRVYHQYPTGIPVLSWMLAKFWERTDYEGFWAVILERDRSVSDLYLDWES